MLIIMLHFTVHEHFKKYLVSMGHSGIVMCTFCTANKNTHTPLHNLQLINIQIFNSTQLHLHPITIHYYVIL